VLGKRNCCIDQLSIKHRLFFFMPGFDSKKMECNCTDLTDLLDTMEETAHSKEILVGVI